MNIEVLTRPSYRVAYVRQVGDYSESTIAWQKVIAWASKKGFLNEKTEAIGISYDDPSKVESSKCRYDACIVLPDGVKVDASIQEQVIQGGLYVCYDQATKLSDIGQSFIEMYTWLAQSPYECIGVPIEFYPDMMQHEPNLNSEWRIIFSAPVKKK